MPANPHVPERPKRLGRGLEALLGSSTATLGPPATLGSANEIPVALIRPNPYQPRREFAKPELDELEASMRASGLLQPIAVRPTDDGFELIAGERRLRAAKSLGWLSIPAIVKHLDQRELLTLALIENLQRSDLNPIEEADGYFRLHKEFSLTQQQISTTVGKDRSTIANLLRLRSLPTRVREMVETGHLSVGHARALLSLPDGTDLEATAERVVHDGLTVRDVERLARSTVTPRSNTGPGTRDSMPTNRTTSTNPEVRRITDLLRRQLQTDVSLHTNKRGEGELRVRFYSADDLERLLQRILGSNWQDR